MRGKPLNWKLASDEDLMAAYQGGESEAFMHLYERYSTKVYNFIAVRLKDRVLTDDIFQATFLKLHQSRGKYDPALPFAPWLFTVCRTTMVDSLRNRQRVQARETYDEEALANASAPVETHTLPVPDLGTLPAAQKQAVELRYLEHLSFDEIAVRLEKSPENIRQLVSRGLKKLKKLGQGGASR